MTGDELAALLGRDVPRETTERLEAFIACLIAANASQNLVSASTLPDLWQRHIIDSAQLVPLAPPHSERWLDIGSGAGLPGMVVAILTHRPVTLIEPRARRAQFLAETAEAIGLGDRITVAQARAEVVPPFAASVISARAVAPLETLFAIGARFATRDTVWLFPKGRSAPDEVAAARHAWQGEIALVPSRTDSQAAIVVARNISPKGRR